MKKIDIKRALDIFIFYTVLGIRYKYKIQFVHTVPNHGITEYVGVGLFCLLEGSIRLELTTLFVRFSLSLFSMLFSLFFNHLHFLAFSSITHPSVVRTNSSD